MYQKKIPDEVCCPIIHGMEMLRGKWKSRIICVLFQKHPLRYGDLKAEMVNVTDAALSNALRELERDCLVQRFQYNEVPMRVEYALTAKGTDAVPILLQIAAWANGDLPLEQRRGDMPLCVQCRFNDP